MLNFHSFPCIICGLCRYGHDLVRLPSPNGPHRFHPWVRELGSDAVRRIVERANRSSNARACREHFDVSSITNSATVVTYARPLKMEVEERKFIDTYLHDHLYFKLTKESCPESILKLISCSLCSGTVSQCEMIRHGCDHCPDMALDEFHCEAHRTLPTLKNDPLRCEYCVDTTRKAALELGKSYAQQCFPMFQFSNTLFKIEWVLAPEYLLNRNIVPNSNIVQPSPKVLKKTSFVEENGKVRKGRVQVQKSQIQEQDQQIQYEREKERKYSEYIETERSSPLKNDIGEVKNELLFLDEIKEEPVDLEFIKQEIDYGREEEEQKYSDVLEKQSTQLDHVAIGYAAMNGHLNRNGTDFFDSY